MAYTKQLKPTRGLTVNVGKRDFSMRIGDSKTNLFVGQRNSSVTLFGKRIQLD